MLQPQLVDLPLLKDVPETTVSFPQSQRQCQYIGALLGIFTQKTAVNLPKRWAVISLNLLMFPLMYYIHNGMHTNINPHKKIKLIIANKQIFK